MTPNGTIASSVVQVAALAAVAHAVIGCSLFIPALEAPMTTVSYEHQPAADARGLVVLLPGVFDEPEQFHEEGFVAAYARSIRSWTPSRSMPTSATTRASAARPTSPS